MNIENPVTFDRISLHTIDRHWWGPGRPESLERLMAYFLAPHAGRAWFRPARAVQDLLGNETLDAFLNGPPGEQWIEVTDGSWETVTHLLRAMGSIWADHEEDGYSCYHGLQIEKLGQCSMILDSERFRACIKSPWQEWDEEVEGGPRPDDPEEAMPGEFYVGFEPAWSYNRSVDTLFTPHLRVTNRWPASGQWAPPLPSDHDQEIMPEEASHLLEDVYFSGVRRWFHNLKFDVGLPPALIQIEETTLNPPVFYYASPTERAEEAEALLQGRHYQALKELGRRVLASPDIRSLEILGGVQEGGLAVFSHSPKPDHEYCLFVPLAGMEEEEIEEKIQFVTYVWHDIDNDATWNIYQNVSRTGPDQTFSSLWLQSVERVLEFNEALSSLLGKPKIQDRMFDLAQTVGEFLAKLQARTYASALKRNELQREVDNQIIESKSRARRLFTVRPITGMELAGNISEGYTRVDREFAKRFRTNTEQAHELAQRIENIGRSLTHVAGLEEKEKDRERAQAQRREEESSKGLNRVLTMLGVLAAIPLLVGSYETTALARTIGWLPGLLGSPEYFWGFGLILSFSAGLAAIGFVFWALRKSSLKNAEIVERSEILEKADTYSETLFDFYRAYRDAAIEGKILSVIKKEASQRRPHCWDESSLAAQAARTEVHDFDLALAKTMVTNLNQSQKWSQAALSEGGEIGNRATPQNPDPDKAWAQYIESLICGFVAEREVFDLRPEYLRLPISLCLIRLKYGKDRPPVNPVADWEFEVGMKSFGYTGDEIQAIEDWAEQPKISGLSPMEFIQACDNSGINSLHPAEFSLEAETLEGVPPVSTSRNL